MSVLSWHIDTSADQRLLVNGHLFGFVCPHWDSETVLIVWDHGRQKTRRRRLDRAKAFLEERARQVAGGSHGSATD
jgi:hypothetical protein